MLLEPPDTAPLATPKCLAASSRDYYFAPGQVDASQDDSIHRRDWFWTYLATAKAPSLSCGEAAEVYRLMWLTPSRHSRIFTVAHGDRGWTLDAVDFGDQIFPQRDGPSPKLLRSTRQISAGDLRRIRQELELFGFWSAQQYRLNHEVDDGYALVIEGRSGDRYRTITRINLWDGAEQVACPIFDIARVMLPDPVRCVRPVTVP